jgi:hypothetical protein
VRAEKPLLAKLDPHQFLRSSRTTIGVVFVVVLLLFLEPAMLKPTWRRRILFVVDQQTLSVVLLPYLKEVSCMNSDNRKLEVIFFPRNSKYLI